MEERVATEVLAVDAAAPEEGVIERAAAVLRAGGRVAFPTETVYGLGANALVAGAVAGIFEAKGRPSYNPLIVHVADGAAARGLVREWTPLAERAAAAFWPGPLTLVLARQPSVPDIVTGGLDTVGVRVPSHPVAQALLRAAALPVAAPSANLSMRVSPTTAAHVLRGLAGRIELVLDGGATPAGIESTVIDATGERAVLLRPGVIGADELEPVLGPLGVAAAAAGREAARRSPGMLERHYAPAGELVVFDDVAEAAQRAAAARRRGLRVGALVRHSFHDADEVLLLPDDPAAYARLLYAALHSLDDAGCDLILVEAVPGTVPWQAVADRLRRAAR